MTDSDAETDRNEITTILAGEFPDIASITPAQYGNTKQTAVVAFDDGDSVVVQRSGDATGHRIEIELTRAIARRTDVPVPSVHASGTHDDTSYAVLEHVPGVDLHERFTGFPQPIQRTHVRRFGRILATLHDAFSFDSFGPVTVSQSADSTATFRATGPDDWRMWFENYAYEGIKALPPAFDDLREPIRSAVDAASLPAAPPSRLYPWDLRPGNALVDDRRLRAVLDWGDPLAAAPGLAVAKTEHLVADWYVENPDPLRRAFREGYRDRRPLPAVPTVYRLVAVVRSAVDASGEVTRPRYPEREGAAAVAFHRERIDRLL